MFNRLQRLRKMKADEVWYRLREVCRRETDRLRYCSGIGLQEDGELNTILEPHGSSCKSYLQCGLAQRFYPSTRNRENVSTLFHQSFPHWLESAIAEANRLCEHRINLFGYSDIHLGSNINWHRDPVNGYEWPRQYWGNYDLVRSN